MRVVAPYKPFPPAIDLYRKFGPEFWVDAAGMCAWSVYRSTGVKLDVAPEGKDERKYDVERCYLLERY